MIKSNKKTVCTGSIVAVLILIAYICRIPGLFNSHTRETGILRAFIYICLYISWGISMRSRIIQPGVRRYMTTIAFLMVFWFTVRTVKYLLNSVDFVTVLIRRYLWYMFYLPMLFIPLLSVFVAFSIGTPENYRLPKKTVLLYIPTTVFFLFVMTNDLHRLVFTFPKDAVLWTDNDYGYNIVYYLLAAWMFICGIIMLVEMCRKRRVSGKRRLILLPCIPIAVLIIYLILYFLDIKWVLFIDGDLTAVMCFMYALTLEICIQCGFIQANTHYMELFDASTVGAQITDEAYNVLLASKPAKSIDAETLRQAQKGPVMLNEGVRLSGAPIQGGHVFWTEDMSPLLKALDELEDAKENLEDSNGILEEEHALKIREAHIAEQERIYNVIQRDTARQIRLIDEMIEQVETADTDEERTRLLYKMLVIGAYLKRRSNLVFLADKYSMLDATELALTIGESIDNLEACGISCGLCMELTGAVLSVHIISMYDFFEEVTERSLDSMDTMMIHAVRVKDSILLKIETDSSAEFSDLVSETTAAEKDEDGEWRLTLRLDTGGDGR